MKKESNIIPWLVIGVIVGILFAPIGIGVSNESEMPIGSVIIWTGHANDFNIRGYLVNNTDWHLCDGRNGTTDLQGKFIVGFNPEETYDEIGLTGGAETVTLTVAQLPAHHHTYFDNFGAYSGSSFTAGLQPYLKTLSGAYYQTQDTGSNQAHENRPPYYVVAFIQKIV